MSGVRADVEYAAGMKFAKDLGDEGFLGGELLRVVVGLGIEILRPVRIFSSGGSHAMELTAEAAEHCREGVLGPLGIRGATAIEAPVRFGAVRKPRGDGDQRQSGAGEPAGPGKRSINLLRLKSIAVGEPDGGGRCAFGKKREQEGADELRVGGPDAELNVAVFERENVDEDG